MLVRTRNVLSARGLGVVSVCSGMLQPRRTEPWRPARRPDTGRLMHRCLLRRSI